MENVRLETHPQLHAFKDRLLKGRYVDGKPMGHTVYSLSVPFVPQDTSDEEDEEDWETRYTKLERALFFILTQTPNLHTYDAPGLSLVASPAVISCLSATTLTTIDINVHPNGDGLFPVINTLQNLRIARLRVKRGEWTHASTQPMSIDGLEDVLWQFCHRESEEPFLAFLSKCWFGTGCGVFELKMPLLSLDKASLLEPLFAAHAFKRIMLSLPAQALVLLGPHITKAEDLTLYNFMPPPGMLPVLPKELTLYFPSQDEEKQEAFWAFLARPSITPVGTKHQRSSAIFIFYADCYQFDWLAHRDADYVAFIGRLLRIAVGLSHCNITIKDVHGRDVTSLTQGGFVP
jgi:hypothetical protein